MTIALLAVGKPRIHMIVSYEISCVFLCVVEADNSFHGKKQELRTPMSHNSNKVIRKHEQIA